MLDFRPETSSKDFRFSQEGNSIICNWDLFKKSEYFIFQAILAYDVKAAGGAPIKPSTLLDKYTNISSRIVNLSEVKKRSYDRPITAKPRVGDAIILLIPMLVFLGAPLAALLGMVTEYDVRFVIGSAVQSSPYSITAQSDTKLKVVSNSGTTSTQNLSDFNSSSRITGLTIARKSFFDSVSVWAFLIPTLFMLVFFVSSLVRLRRDLRMRKIFQKQSKDVASPGS
jgi:hypothetical protein